MTVYLYDISAMIYAGTLSRRTMYWNHYCFPTGGIYKVLSYLMRDIKNIKQGDKIIACVDSKESIRKKYFSDYKENRVGKLSPTQYKLLKLQYDVIEEALKDAGVLVAKVDGLEADDLMYSFAYKFPNEDVIIRADDGDLDDTKLFCSKASIQSVSGRESIRMGDNVIISKILNGDLKDNIKALPNDIVCKSQVMNWYLSGELNIFDTTLTYDRLLKYGLDPDFTKALYKNIFLKAPKIIDVGEIKDTVVNKDSLRKLFSIFSLQNFLKSSNMTKDTSEDVSNKFIEYLSRLDSDVRDFFVNKEYKTYDFGVDIDDYLKAQANKQRKELSSIEDKVSKWRTNNT